MTYVLITLAVLLFLNVYCSKISQKIFYQSKQSSMQEKAQIVAYAIAEQDVVNQESVRNVVDQLGNLTVTRLIVTDHAGLVMYDSLPNRAESGVFALYPEIVQALQGNDVFTWRYHDGVMESQAAAPILSYNTLTGAVYIMEYDSAQGELIKSLQMNLLVISAVLIVVITLFSIFFSKAFSKRMRKIIASVQVIRDGEYAHKIALRGNDELAVLGRQFNDLTDQLSASERKRQQFVSDASHELKTPLASIKLLSDTILQNEMDLDTIREFVVDIGDEADRLTRMSASHELKTPLASIKLLSDTILQNEMDLDTIREFVVDIGDEADRLTRMSAKLLSLTKVNAQSSTECEIVYIGPTISRVVRMLSAIADNAAITIRTEIVTDCSILIQEDDLYQILFNLVENGIKYNIPGGRVTMRSSPTAPSSFKRTICIRSCSIWWKMASNTTFPAVG